MDGLPSDRRRVSRKGGVGKTTTTLMLGPHVRVAARRPGDRAGRQPRRRLARLPRAARDDQHDHRLLAHRNQIQRYADIRAYTSQAPTRLEVVAADDDPRITDALREEDFHTAVELARGPLQPRLHGHRHRRPGVGGEGDPPARRPDRRRHGPEPRHGADGHSTLDWLERNGHADLVAGAVAVINAVRPQDSQVELDRVAEHFAARCRGPWCGSRGIRTSKPAPRAP